MMSVRNVGPFLMLAAPTLTRLFALTESDAEDRSRPQRQEHPLINLCAMTFIPLLVILTLSSAYRLQIPHLRWSPLPNASLQALDRCPDNLYNRYDEGGYLVWFAPRHRVFLDGRQDPYPPAVIRDQLKAEHSGEYASTFAQYGIRCAYLPTSSPVARRLASAGWATLYRDRQWVVLAN